MTVPLGTRGRLPGKTWPMPERHGDSISARIHHDLADLYREQGRFDEAEQVILTIDDRDVDVTSKLIARLIQEKQPAPMRYMM